MKTKCFVDNSIKIRDVGNICILKKGPVGCDLIDLFSKPVLDLGMDAEFIAQPRQCRGRGITGFIDEIQVSARV